MPFKKTTEEKVAAALSAADSFGEIQADVKSKPIEEGGEGRLEKPELKSINIRFAMPIYKLIGRVAGANAMSRADFCRQASTWLAKEVEAGRIDVTGGVITKQER
jgi:hypothetical protein